ncbi:MAG: CHAD domain-containing protein, partial [Thermodesulfobacteriota bacterium]
DMSAAEAVKIIFSNLLETIKQNENGIKKDIDTEFLHDFRVAVRRTRSAFSQIKGVFPERDVERLKKKFSIIGKKTNRLRDLDVYLLEKNKYMEMLSEYLGAGLVPIFKKLATERKTEQNKLATFLESGNYKKIVSHFENYLLNENVNPGSAPNSDKKIIELAQKFIWKKYNQIIDKGRKIDELSPDPILHELRIECKKLRYLLEFFYSLFPEKEISNIIKQLKKLQDNLGDFNDLFVQQQSLKNMLDKFNSRGSEIKKVSASVGGLIAVFYQKQKEIRAEFSNCFSELNNEENFKLFSKLFYTEGEVEK